MLGTNFLDERFISYKVCNAMRFVASDWVWRAQTTDRAKIPLSGRIAWIDYSKGLAIILVVYGHSFRGVRSAGYATTNGLLSQIDYLIYTFHMPLFFALSGLLAARSVATTGRAFWLGRIGALVYPYVIWMTVQIMALLAFSGVTNQGVVSLSLSTYLYQPVSPFWFLYALLVCHLVAHFGGRFGRPAMLAVAVVAFATIRLMSQGLVQDISWGLLYFMLGIVFSRSILSSVFTAWISLSSTTVILTSAWAVSAAVCLALGINNEMALPAAVLGSLATFSLAAQLARYVTAVPALAVVAYLGQITLTVLVVHVLGTAATRIVLVRFLGVHEVGVHIVCGTMVGLCTAVGVQKVGGRLHVLRALGLPRLII